MCAAWQYRSLARRPSICSPRYCAYRVFSAETIVGLNSFANPRENSLLARLPDSEWKRLQPHLEAVEMPLAQVLYKSDTVMSHVYFPTSSIVSLLYVMENGASPEIAVGDDIPSRLRTVAAFFLDLRSNAVPRSDSTRSFPRSWAPCG